MTIAPLLDFMMRHAVLVGLFACSTLALGLLELWRMRQRPAAVSPQQLTAMLNRENAYLIDLRDAAQFREGHIAGAHHVNPERLAEHLHGKKLDGPLILCCHDGTLSATMAAEVKQVLAGQQDVFVLRHGLNGWRQEGLPLVTGKHVVSSKR